MKKSVLLAAGVCLLSSMAAFADPVTSVNAVGVTKLNLPAGYSMIACPFNSVGGQALSLDEMFGTNLPDSSLVYVYVPGTGYVIYLYAEGVGWLDDNFDPAGSNKILRGEGFWVYTPSLANGVALAGEVPASAVGTNSVNLINGFQLVSFGFPQEIALTDSGLVPTDADLLYKYAGGTYVIYLYADGMGWLDDNFNPVTITLKPNEPFWYFSQASGTNVWSQNKTYVWP